MRPEARLQAAIDILARIEADIDQGIAAGERRIQEWGRAARYAGAKDRRAVADLVYAALRRRGTALGSAERDAPTLLAAARARRAGAFAAARALREDAAFDDPVAARAATRALFSGERHAPAPLSADEESALAEALAAEATQALDFPGRFARELARSVSDPASEIAALARRGAADLRANTLKTTRAAAIARLGAEGAQAGPGPIAPHAVRLAEPTRISKLGAFGDGWIEPQDAASQAAAALSTAKPGERALDYCAGGGGKTLALAALMGGSAPGALGAFDVAPQRMVDLPDRAARAGARIDILRRAELRAWRGAADLVFVDAPCSGSGAWARHPDAKWATGDARLRALQSAQIDALDAGAAHVRPGGRLVYATCSLFAMENQEQIAAFLERRPEFEPAHLDAAWRQAGLADAPPSGPSAAPGWTLIPPSWRGTEGFFVAILRRSGSVRLI